MLVEACSGNALSRAQCYRWIEKFPNGDFDVRKKNEERGRPAKKFADAELQALLDEDDGQMQELLAEQLNVYKSAVSRRLKAMGKEGPIYYELLKPSESVNTDRYKQQLRNLNNAILGKREQYQKEQHKVIFLDDNASCHRAKPTKDIVKALGWEPLAHAAYSPDLAPSDYYLFASLGHALAD
ncbi:mariner Mos1 transposase [Trichonephila clavipes]|uniref:Mariner Mos1 transposase n=1 Tax=Trichonephila clavipes TaxID=2585209 RepID=A0A8X6WHR9_TRICX|nr:mariner Mos1 transposase [Trichonephila clavipes]